MCGASAASHVSGQCLSRAQLGTVAEVSAKGVLRMQGSLHEGCGTGCPNKIKGDCQGAVLPAVETGAAVPFLEMLTSAVLLQILSELVESARSHNFTDLVMVHEHRGEPDGLVVCHLPYGPTAYFGIFNTVGLRISHSALPVRWALHASATPELKCLLGCTAPAGWQAPAWCAKAALAHVLGRSTCVGWAHLCPPPSAFLLCCSELYVLDRLQSCCGQGT